MALRRRPAPPACDAAFRRALQARRRSASIGTAESPGPGPTTAEEEEAYPVYAVSIRDLARAAPIAEVARLTSWRHLVMEKGRWSAAEVADRGGAHRVTSWNRGRLNATIRGAVARAATSPDVAGGDYDIRLLQVPALCVYALWLLDAGTGQSLILPLPPTDPALEPHRAYTGEEFVAALAGSALRRVQGPDPT